MCDNTVRAVIASKTIQTANAIGLVKEPGGDRHSQREGAGCEDMTSAFSCTPPSGVWIDQPIMQITVTLNSPPLWNVYPLV